MNRHICDTRRVNRNLRSSFLEQAMAVTVVAGMCDNSSRFAISVGRACVFNVCAHSLSRQDAKEWSKEIVQERGRAVSPERKAPRPQRDDAQDVTTTTTTTIAQSLPTQTQQVGGLVNVSLAFRFGEYYVCCDTCLHLLARNVKPNSCAFGGRPLAPWSGAYACLSVNTGA